MSFVNNLRRRRPRPGDKWHLDEVFIPFRGEQHYLWRAVDQNGIVLDILVQSYRDAIAAKRFFQRLLTGLQDAPGVLVTDELRRYGVAKREVLPGVKHRQSRYLNNQAENSHRPTPRRQRGKLRLSVTSDSGRPIQKSLLKRIARELGVGTGTVQRVQRARLEV